MSGFELRHVQAANAVAEELSFSRAAIRLHLTQPALTKQIQELEAYLGVVLFDRSNQRVELTDPCRVFIEETRISLVHLDRAVHLTRSVAKGVEAVLNLGFSPYTDPYLVSTILAIRLPLFTSLRIQASSNFSAELNRQVLTGEIDVALSTAGLQHAKLNYLELSVSPLYVVFGRDDPLAHKMEAKLSDLGERIWVIFGRHIHPTLYDEFMMRARAVGVKSKQIHHVTTADEAAHLIVQLDAVAFLTKIGAWRIATGSLTIRPLTEAEILLRTTIVTRAEDTSRLTSEFVRAAVKQIEKTTKAQQRHLPLAG
ncbi:MAG: LysR substrate-binding domain-containing protein [Acidobacteriota bacterium]|nr:LysR substrate-binding domain-containing protein [Acidobacteriota bacterium]